MDAKLQQHGDVTVVHVGGQLNLEKNQFFREICIKELMGKKVVFSLQGLKFVGSSGIQTFFRTLNEVQASNPFGVKISGLKPDFLRILQYTATSGLEIHENLEFAVQSFSQPIQPTSITGTPTEIPVVELVLEDESSDQG